MILWRTRGTTRCVGQLEERSIDDFRTLAGGQWMRLARDSITWKNGEGLYVYENGWTQDEKEERCGPSFDLI